MFKKKQDSPRDVVFFIIWENINKVYKSSTANSEK